MDVTNVLMCLCRPLFRAVVSMWVSDVETGDRPQMGGVLAVRIVGTPGSTVIWRNCSGMITLHLCEDARLSTYMM